MIIPESYFIMNDKFLFKNDRLINFDRICFRLLLPEPLSSEELDCSVGFGLRRLSPLEQCEGRLDASGGNLVAIDSNG